MLKTRKTLALAAGALLATASFQCSKSNDVDASTNTTSTTVGDICGPKVACADGTCAFGYCRNPCTDDSDCANGGVCLSDGATKACRLPLESKCSASAPCPAGLTCGGDGSCRTPCDASRPCEIKGQACQAGTCATGTGTGGAAGTAGATSGGAAGSTTGGTAGKASGGAGSGGSGGGGAGSGGSSGGGQAGAGGGAGQAGSGGGCSPVLDQACCPGDSCGTSAGMVCTGGKCACDLGLTDCDSKPENGCEVNLTTDDKNCGKCGQDCLGGACAGGKCQPKLLISSKDQWSDGNSVYGAMVEPRWFDDAGFVIQVKDGATGQMRLQRFDPAGQPGAFVTGPIAEGIVGPHMTTKSIYWRNPTTTDLKRIAKSGGGSVTTLDSDPAGITDLRILDDTLYYRKQGAYYRLAEGSLTPELVLGSLPSGVAPLVVGSEVFTVVRYDIPGLLWELRSGPVGGVQTLRYKQFAAVEANTPRLTRLSGGLLAYSFQGADPEYVTAVAFDTATNMRKGLIPATAGTGASFVAATDAWVYYVYGGQLSRVPVAGGTAQAIASGVVTTEGIGYNGKQIVWHESDIGIRGVAVFE